MSQYSPILFSVVMCASAGYLIGQSVGAGPMGILGGILIGIPIGLAIVTKRRRWLAATVQAVVLLIALQRGGIAGLSLVLLTFGLALFVSGSVLKDLYGGNEWTAFVEHFWTLLGRTQGFIIVDEGKVVFPPDQAAILGPRTVVIRPFNAVIMVQGGLQTRIKGPGVFRSASFEYIGGFFDLRPKSNTIELWDASSRDRATVHAKITYIYEIGVAQATRTGQPITETDVSVIRRLADWVKNWEAETECQIESLAHQLVSELDLDQLGGVSGYGAFGADLMKQANLRLNPFGVSISSVNIDRIQPTDDITTAYNELWLANTRRQISGDDMRARAQAWRDAVLLTADGYQKAAALGMTEAAIQQDVLARTLEMMAKDPATKIVITPEISDALERLLRSLGESLRP